MVSSCSPLSRLAWLVVPEVIEMGSATHLIMQVRHPEGRLLLPLPIASESLLQQLLRTGCEPPGRQQLQAGQLRHPLAPGICISRPCSADDCQPSISQVLAST